MNITVGTRETLLLAACLIAAAGCRGEQSAGEAEALEDHAGHVIPAHKPKDFPSAVRRLRELNEQINSKLADGKARSLVAEKTLPIAHDIANWLPEIAADSEMPESLWNTVNDRSAALVASYQRLLMVASIDDQPADASTTVNEADAIIKALEKLLDTADPRWFDPTNLGVR